VNVTAEVTRAQKIRVCGWTPDQQEIELEAEDLAAVCIQHEIDHLEGTLLIHHISKLKRDMYRKRLKKGGPDALGPPSGVPHI
jgi:peptide deformylase